MDISLALTGLSVCLVGAEAIAKVLYRRHLKIKFEVGR